MDYLDGDPCSRRTASNICQIWHLRVQTFPNSDTNHINWVLPMTSCQACSPPYQRTNHQFTTFSIRNDLEATVVKGELSSHAIDALMCPLCLLLHRQQSNICWFWWPSSTSQEFNPQQRSIFEYGWCMMTNFDVAPHFNPSALLVSDINTSRKGGLTWHEVLDWCMSCRSTFPTSASWLSRQKYQIH